MKNRTTAKRVGLMVLGCSVAALWCAGAAIGVLEDTQANGWSEQNRQSAGIEYGADGTSVTVTFGRNRASDMPVNQRVDLVAGAASDGTAFVGDFDAAGVQGVQFAVTSDGNVPATRLLFFRVGVNGPEYKHPFEVPAAAGQTVQNVISMTSGEGWIGPRNSTVTKEQLREALKNVGQIGVRLQAGYPTEGETYTVSDFRLQGDGYVSEPASLRPVITRLARIEQNLRLRWETQAGRRYSVLRGTDLSKLDEPDAFLVVPGAENLLADGALLEKDVPVEEGDGTVFFVIRKEP